MPSSSLHYRLRIRTASDEADLLSVTTVRGGTNPYIAAPPEGDGTTLDPLTGKVTVGAYTVKVIDAVGQVYNPGGASITAGFEYANQSAAESDGWFFEHTMPMPPATITLGATDQVHGGTYSLKMTTTAGSGAGGYLHAKKVFNAGHGILANRPYRVTVWARMDVRSWFDVSTRLYANGVAASLTTGGAWALLTVEAYANDVANLNIMLERRHAYVTQTRSVWWDDLTIEELQATGDVEGRVVTSVLADLDARQQLMSKPALVEESEDGGATWAVVQRGYVNKVALLDALLAEITVGDSKRVEQSRRVFDRISDPDEHPLFIGTLDRASCLMGGPIFRDWGGFYTDRGRPAFEVLDDFGNDVLNVGWTNDGGSLHAIYKEDGPPMEDWVAEWINDSAREYVDPDVTLGSVGILDFALAPDLICRIYDYDTSAWVTDVPCVLRRLDGAAGLDTEAWGLVSHDGHFSIRWDGASPGDKYRFAVFPRTTSERNPMHWSGHPMDLVANVLDYIGTPYNLASLQAMGEFMGLDLKIHLRITEGDLAQPFLEKTVYGVFGVAARPNDDGEVEFVPSRSPDTVSSGTITEADLPTPLAGTPWYVEEGSAANRVIVKTHAFIPDLRRPDSGSPFDAIRDATMTCDIKPPEASENAVYGDKEVGYTLPGSIQVGDSILKAGKPKQESGVDVTPAGTLDTWCANLAQPLFDWQGRGAIRAELDVRRGVTDARVGDVLTLDLGYFPSANPAQFPVAQRGTDPRRAVVLQRTVKPDRVSLLVEDRGLGEALECDPAFTLAPDFDFPKTTVTVTVTNEDDLRHPLRVEMAQGASEPAGNGQFVQLWWPNRDANPFDLPPVCAGNVVWVRMRCELGGQIGDWAAWQSLDLADLIPPSGVSAVVNNTSIALTWTNGETAYPVEVLARLNADTTLHSVAVLPAGSTSYTLLLTEASTAYIIGVRYIDSKGCTSATTTVGATTDVPLCLEPPTGLAAFADGKGTYGVEMDASVVPGGIEIWAAVETAVGSGTPGSYTQIDAVVALAPPLRTRWTVTAPTPNDGKLRYIKAESSQAGYTACGFSSVVSVNPWTLVTPVDPDPDPEPTQTGITSQPARISLIRPGKGGFIVGLPGSDLAALSSDRAPEAKAVLTGVTAARIDAIVIASSLPVGAYLSVEFELIDAPGAWQPLEADDGTGPTLALDPASLAVLDPGAEAAGPWNVSGAFVAVLEDAADDVRLRVRIGGGDATGLLILGDVDLEPSYGSLADPPFDEDPPTEDPGSCDIPTPVDMNTGWTGGNETGAAWSLGSDTSYTLSMDGTGSGDNYWSKVFGGGTPDETVTFYLDVTTTELDVGPFLEVVGGDTTVATASGTLTARGTYDGSGNVTVRWGVQDLAAATGGLLFSDQLDYTTTALMEAGGWTKNQTLGATLSVETSDTDGETAVVKASLNSGHGSAWWARTLTGTVGKQYDITIKGKRSPTSGYRFDTGGRLECDPGGDTKFRLDWETLTLRSSALAAGGALDIRFGRFGDYFGIGQPWYQLFSHISVRQVGGGTTTVLFEDLGRCEGTGLPQTPPEDDPPEVEPPPGGWPPPPVGGTRPFGAYGLPTGTRVGYWNSTVKKLRSAFGVNTVNATVTGEMKNIFTFGETDDWLTGGRFDYNRWKAIVDEVYNYTVLKNLLDDAIADGWAWATQVIDEPYHPTRYGGPIPFATIERMCIYMKSKWPTWRTIVRVAPTFPWITRRMVGCDTLWAEYLPPRGDCATFRDENIARAVALGHTLVLGIHYWKFYGERGPERAITPSELEHYGGILWNTTSPAVVAAHGWQYRSAVWNQPGFPDTLHRRRDAFNALDIP